MQDPVRRRYFYRVVAAMTAYVLTTFAARTALDKAYLEGPAAIAIVLLPGLSIAGAFWALARYLVEQTDEFLRMLLARQYLIATAITMTAITIWGTLADFGVVAPMRAHFPVWIFFAGVAIGAIINKRTHGAGVYW